MTTDNPRSTSESADALAAALAVQSAHVVRLCCDLEDSRRLLHEALRVGDRLRQDLEASQIVARAALEILDAQGGAP